MLTVPITSRTIHVTHLPKGESQFHLRCYDASMNCVAELIFYNPEVFKNMQRTYPEMKVTYSTGETNMYYSKNVDDAAALEISDTFSATLSLIDEQPVTVQLTSKEEADQLIKEWEDANLGEGDGGLCYESTAVMNYRSELHPFRP